jgi:HemY protein
MEALRDQNWDEAERLADKLRRLRPETPWLNLIRFELSSRKQDWLAAGDALNHAAQARLIEPHRARQQQAAVLVADAQSEQRQGHADKALQLAERAVRQAPEWLPALIELAREQIRSGHRRAAHRTVERAWARSPHPQLAAVYKMDREINPVEIYKQLEKLCRDSTDQPISHRVLAEAALDADIWGEARRHLMALVGKPGATQSTFRLLARLERAEGNNETAAGQWLSRTADAPPDPVWLCRACGGGHEEWVPLCRHCNTFNSLEWQVPGQSRSSVDTTAGFLAAWHD